MHFNPQRQNLCVLDRLYAINSLVFAYVLVLSIAYPSKDVSWRQGEFPEFPGLWIFPSSTPLA
jgi:hypothetical protein